MTNDDLIRRLCEASEGSAELSAEVWTALTGIEHRLWKHRDGRVAIIYNDPQLCDRLVRRYECLTTDLSAAWEEARRKYSEIALVRNRHGECSAELWVPGGHIGTRQVALVYGKHEACTLTAAMLAAEGER
jgi:hypothetical protein